MYIDTVNVCLKGRFVERSFWKVTRVSKFSIASSPIPHSSRRSVHDPFRLSARRNFRTSARTEFLILVTKLTLSQWVPWWANEPTPPNDTPRFSKFSHSGDFHNLGSLFGYVGLELWHSYACEYVSFNIINNFTSIFLLSKFSGSLWIWLRTTAELGHVPISVRNEE